jgi:hypothetical protein
LEINFHDNFLSGGEYGSSEGGSIDFRDCWLTLSAAPTEKTEAEVELCAQVASKC